MTFDHEDIEKNNVIDDYLLGNLSEEDEYGFEEHLLNCEICRNKVLQTEKVINGLEHFANKLADRRVLETRKKSKRLINIFMRVAAVFLSAAIISILYVHIKNSSHISDSDTGNHAKSQQSEPASGTISSEEINKQKTENNTKISLQKNKTGFREDTLFHDLAYEPSAVLENAIGNQVRGTEISVKVPANSAVFIKGDTIIFDWSIPDHSSAWLVIKNNRGVTLLKKNVSPPAREQLNKPGLFYWQLIVNDDVIYTGKIVVNE